MAEGKKHDQGKPRMDLIPTAPLVGIAEVLTFGSIKYEPHNWRKGIVFSRLYAAALRHLTSWNDGQDLDEETGLSHLDHAMCCLVFIRQLIADERLDLDDRFKK